MGESWSNYLACGQRRTKEKTEEKNKSNIDNFNKFLVVPYLDNQCSLLKKKNRWFSLYSDFLINAQRKRRTSLHCNKMLIFSLRIKKTVKKMRRKMRRNKNRSVGDLLWNLLFHQTHLYPKHLIVKVNQEPEVHGTTCQIPHLCQMEQKVHLMHSCSGMEVHVNSDVMQCINTTTSVNRVLSEALKSCLTSQCTSNMTKTHFWCRFDSLKINIFNFDFSNTSQADKT